MFLMEILVIIKKKFKKMVGSALLCRLLSSFTSGTALVSVHRFLIAVASLAEEHRL